MTGDCLTLHNFAWMMLGFVSTILLFIFVLYLIDAVGRRKR